MMNRNEMLEALGTGTCRVVFTKVNGDERDMTCTRVLDKIPMEDRPKGDDSLLNEETLRVFDVKAQGWRSFRVNSVKLFEKL
jgi:hypothetical protein